MFLFIFERETEHEWGRGREREREGDTESEAGCRLWDVSTEPDAGLEPANREIMTQAEVGRLTDWATQVPQVFLNFHHYNRTTVNIPLAKSFTESKIFP